MERALDDAARIPALGIGTWQLRGEACVDRVADALAIGYRHVDTAQAYGNEAEVGRGLRDSGVDRSEVFVATKLAPGGERRDAVLRSAEESAEQLGSGWIDLLLIHWPSDEVPLQETLDAMLELRERGLVRLLGVSNFPPSWLECAAGYAPLVCDPVEYHPLLSQDALLERIRELAVREERRTIDPPFAPAWEREA